jgi:hypothetical protein
LGLRGALRRPRPGGRDRALPARATVRVRRASRARPQAPHGGRDARPVSDGAFTSPEPFEAALRQADLLLEPAAPFHIHFSDIDFANRNEKSHLPYGQGTLRAEPLAEALAAFDRPATVIGESPDEWSNQAIRSVLVGQPGAHDTRQA